jgi:2-phosphoglycolate phosphatase
LEPLENGLCNAVLFDLDGTLVDTAPDMVAVLIDLQLAHDRHPVPYEIGRRQVSNGALGLLRVGFPDLFHEFGSALHLEYLERYARRICESSRVFPGLPGLLDELDDAHRPWGVVTNKPMHLTNPLLESLALAARSACTVSGDTVAARKPSPEPLLYACDLADLKPQTTIYVGDAARDIEAGLNAGMPTIAAAYGYIAPDDDPAGWGADQIAADTSELAEMVRKALKLDAR